MQCATCGSTLPAAGAACTLCDPWATPTTGPAAAAPVGLPVERPSTPQIPAGPATYLGSSLPRWYRMMIRRNPAVPTADLDVAWRCTIVSFAVNALVFAAYTITSIVAASTRTSAGYQHSVIVFVAGAAVAAVASLLLRRRTWLGRVIALLGSRPDLGYAPLLQIPPMSRLSTLNSGGQSVVSAVCCVFVVITERQGPGLLWVPFLAALILTICQLALMSAAREPVARLLASPPIQPAPSMQAMQPVPPIA